MPFDRPTGPGFSWAEEPGAFVTPIPASLRGVGWAPGSFAEPLTLSQALREAGEWTQNLAALQPETGVPRTHNILPASSVMWIRSPSSGSVVVEGQPNGAIKIEYTGGTGAITGNLVRLYLGTLAGCSRPGAEPLLSRLRLRLNGIQAGATDIQAELLSRSTQIPIGIQVHGSTSLSSGTSEQYITADGSLGSITTPELDAAGVGAALFLSVTGDLADSNGVFFIQSLDIDTLNKGIA